MTEDTDVQAVGMRPAADPAGAGAGVPGPADVVTLLPCPFCGGQAYHAREERAGYADFPDDPDRWAYVVRCHACAAQGGWSKSSRGGAARWWNTRADATHAVEAEVAGMRARERKLVEALQRMQQERDFYLTSAVHITSAHGGLMVSCHDDICRFWAGRMLALAAQPAAPTTSAAAVTGTPTAQQAASSPAPETVGPVRDGAGDAVPAPEAVAPCSNCGRHLDEHGGYGDPDYPAWRRECPVQPAAPEAEPERLCVLCGDTDDNALHRSQKHPGAHPFTPAPR